MINNTKGNAVSWLLGIGLGFIIGVGMLIVGNSTAQAPIEQEITQSSGH